MKSIVVQNGLTVIEGSSVLNYKKRELPVILEGVNEFQVSGMIPVTMYNNLFKQIAALGFEVASIDWKESVPYEKPGFNFQMQIRKAA